MFPALKLLDPAKLTVFAPVAKMPGDEMRSISLENKLGLSNEWPILITLTPSALPSALPVHTLPFQKQFIPGRDDFTMILKVGIVEDSGC